MYRINAGLVLVIYAVTLLFGLSQAQTVHSVSKCNQTRNDEADLCMQKMFLIGDRSQRFRETLPQMKAYCKQILELQSCVKRFSRECLPELGRQVTSLLMYGVKKVNRQYCANEKGMLRFNEIAKCGNHELNKKHDCMDNFLNELRLVEKQSDLKTVEHRIHFVCCYFSRFKECIQNTFDQSNSDKLCPSEELKEKVTELIGSYADDALDMVCGEFSNDNDKCSTIFDQQQTKPNRNAKTMSRQKDSNKKEKSSASKKNAKSILPYFVNIFGDL